MSLVIAHRGASIHELENSMSAFKRAVAFSADYIEVDVRVSKDGVPFLLHDETLDRTCERPGRLEELDAATIDQNRLVNGDPLPRLEHVLEELRGQIRFDLELKVEEAVEPTLELLRCMNMEDDVLITSFEPNAIRQVRDEAPEIDVALLMGIASFHPVVRANEALPFYNLKRSKAEAVAIHYKLLYSYLEAMLTRLNYRIYLWTVDEVELFERYAQPPYTGIITDRCDLLREYLNNREEVVSP